jgi:hypothetical protein
MEMFLSVLLKPSAGFEVGSPSRLQWRTYAIPRLEKYQ